MRKTQYNYGFTANDSLHITVQENRWNGTLVWNPVLKTKDSKMQLRFVVSCLIYIPCYYIPGTLGYAYSQYGFYVGFFNV